MQKELVLQFPKRKLSHSIQSAIMHSQSHRGYHNASLLPSPQVSLTVASFLGAPRRLSVTMPPFSQVPSSPYLMLPSWQLQGGDQPPLLPTGARSDWGLALGLTWYGGHSWWAGLYLQWVRLGLGCPESQNTSLKENSEYRQVAHLLVCLGIPSLQPGHAISPAAQEAGMVGESRWSLKKCCRN